jgi:integrase/recombinase XerD
MSETPISPVRQRMIEDMTVRKLGAAAQRNYIRAVKILSEFLGRAPAVRIPICKTVLSVWVCSASGSA